MIKSDDTDKCIACSTCVVQCPVAEATTKFLGPRMIGPASERFRLLNSGEDSSLSYCSNCKNCDIACPQGVSVSNINMLARAEYLKANKPSFRDWILAHGELEGNITKIVPYAIANFGMGNIISKKVLDVIGISQHADLPKFCKNKFIGLLKKYKQSGSLNKKVALYPGCYITNYAPQTGIDLIWLLNRAGYEVVASDKFKCCGTPLYTNGFVYEAKRNCEKNIRIILEFQQEKIPVLFLCPSCELMFKSEIHTFFPELNYKGENVINAEEFLLYCIESGKLVIPENDSMQQKIMYHAPCHLRALGIGTPGHELLNLIKNSSIKNASAGCCGLSGTYGFKKEKYDISMQIGNQLFKTIENFTPDIVATECGTCKIQIMHGTQKACEHPVTLLKRYGEMSH